MLVINPMAEGVGVKGGGLVGVSATFRRLLGVDGGGGMALLSACGNFVSTPTAEVAVSSLALPLRPRFFEAARDSTRWPSGASCESFGCACTRADRRRDMPLDLYLTVKPSDVEAWRSCSG